MILIPLDDIVVAAALVSPLVIAGVQMAKSIGLDDGRLKAAAAIILGQAIALAHWYVAWERTAENLFLAVLVGFVSSAIAMGIWAKALKQGVEGQES